MAIFISKLLVHQRVFICRTTAPSHDSLLLRAALGGQVHSTLPSLSQLLLQIKDRFHLSVPASKKIIRTWHSNINGL